MRRLDLALSLALLALGCVPAPQRPATTFVLAAGKASLSVRVAAGYATQALRPGHWDRVTATLQGGEPAVTLESSAIASPGPDGSQATLAFPALAPGSGYRLELRFWRTGETAPVGTSTREGIDLTPGANQVVMTATVVAGATPAGAVLGGFVTSIPSEGTPVRLNDVQGIVEDGRGRFMLLDFGRLRMVIPDGAGGQSLVTLAGIANSDGRGLADGQGTAARFNNPTRLVRVPDGFYVLDTGNHAIRKVTIDAGDRATVTTVAGTGLAGNNDGAANAARFNAPKGLALGPDGTLYVADTGNHCIRKLSPDGNVSTVAGTGSAGFQDGPAAAAAFNSPQGIDVDPVTGRLYVADTGNLRIRAIDPDGTVRTMLGKGSGRRAVDVPLANVVLGSPLAVRRAQDGSLFVLETDLLQFDPVAGTLHLVTGQGRDTTGDVPATEANLHDQKGLDLDGLGRPMVSEGPYVRRVVERTDGPYFERVVGDYVFASGTDASADGSLSYAHGIDAGAMTLGPDGRLYYCSNDDHRILRLDPRAPDAPPEVVVPGSPGGGYRDGPAATALLYGAADMAFGPDGALYFSDGTNTCIRKITWAEGSATVSTAAGGSLIGVSEDEIIADDDPRLLFANPSAIAFAPDGKLYVSDPDKRQITVITFNPSGPPSQASIGVASSASGVLDGPLAVARFASPGDLAFDANGGLLVVDNTRLRRVDLAQGTVTTLLASQGTADGPISRAGTKQLRCLVRGNQSEIYFGDGARVRKLAPDDRGQLSVFTVAGSDPGFADGPLATARFGTGTTALGALAYDPAGIVYVADPANRTIRRINLL